MTAKTILLTAKELMHHDVAYVTAEMTLVDLANFLDDNKIHGAPVIGSRNQLVGVVSRTDLARAITEGGSEEPHLTWFRMLNEEGEFEGVQTDLDQGNLPGGETTVGEIMSTTVVTAEADWPAGKVAEEMMKTGVHRLLVLDKGRVVGIVSATDLLKAVVDYEAKLG